MKHFLLPSLHHPIHNSYTNKYDAAFERDTTFTAGGMILLMVFFISSIIIQAALANNLAASNFIYITYAAIALIVRIGVTRIVVPYAKKLHRDHIAWGLFAFILPAIAMIVIGQKHKYKV